MLIHRVLNFIYEMVDYRLYKRKYKLPSGFRFNGYGTRIIGDGNIVSGDISYISYCSHVVVVSGTTLNIGRNVSISHCVRIYTSSFSTEHRIKYEEDFQLIGDVIIGDNVLIGSGCFICPGVEIGSNTVVGANSVVTKSISGNGVYGGVPAKLIKDYNGI